MSGERNYGAFYGLLGRLPGADKEELVRQYTGGRTASLRQMSSREYRLMLSELKRRGEDQDKLRRARSAALRQLQLYGLDTTHWHEINRFVSQPRITGKLFAKLTIPELVGLTRKMRAIMAKGETRAKAEAIGRYNEAAVHQGIRGQKGS